MSGAISGQVVLGCIGKRAELHEGQASKQHSCMVSALVPIYKSNKPLLPHIVFASVVSLQQKASYVWFVFFF